MNGDAAEDPGLDPVAVVEAWRARGASKADPVGFGVIVALARRAAAQQGLARQLMLRRVQVLLAAHAAAPPAATRVRAAVDERAMRQAALGGLSELVDRLGRAPAAPEPVPDRASKPRWPDVARQADSPKPAVHRPQARPTGSLKAVTAFKGTWSRLRAEQRLRQTLDQVPAMAGPLNSSHVVNRALQALHGLSPAYLDAFMSHVDTLLWLEQASGAGDLAPRQPAPAEGKARPGARGARKG